MSVHLSEALFFEMGEKLRAAYPDEGCGILIGRAPSNFADEARALAVSRLHPLANAWEGSAKRTRYQVPGSELARLEKELAGTGEAILGFYHSHPDVPAWPSPFDLERAWPFYAYLIVSVREGRAREARSWRLSGDGRSFAEEEVRVVEGAKI